ncbi:NINE protein [Solimicrobium silvestre]|uniref:TM2 domain-containing protein n=1 Tax=Solimicrobium silvestre TaxID=2099400 RepID=A0A2S9H4T3_9BURK|nr:NINE protein [Solimicrobium silvestre]PRC94995.1 hypothetical protein S2091_0190 [Solimicrobium silvestre]
MTTQQTSHKNKTIAALLASIGGGIGMHRFYLAGWRDKWAWLHFASLPISLLIYFFSYNVLSFFTAAPLILSVLIGFLASLVIGTTSDEKWDTQFNANSSQKSESGWPIAMILVLTLGIGAGSLIAVIARTSDLFLTGGLYG